MGNGAVVLALAVEGEENREVCPDGRVCLFDGQSFNGDSLRFYECGFEKLRHYDFTNDDVIVDQHPVRGPFGRWQLAGFSPLGFDDG